MNDKIETKLYSFPAYLNDRTEEDPNILYTDQYNRAAEDYFVRLKNTEYVHRKPFTSAQDMAEWLYRFGILVAGLDLNAADIVLDFGAGTCWTSLMLGRTGIHAVAVDISATALEIGQRVFESTTSAQRGVPPRFVKYDGHRLPFDDGYFDAILCFDAFHHVPNKEAILREMFRVLAPGGRAAFSEPGEEHSRHIDTQRIVKEYGVLESDVNLPDVETWARRAGFDRLTIWPYPLLGTVEMAWADAQRFITGCGDVFPLREFRHAATAAPIFFLHKGVRDPDSRHPRTLRAEIQHQGAGHIKTTAGGPLVFICTVKNVGDTRWLSGPLERGGEVCLGAHLLDAWEHVQQLDYGRARLPRDIPPGHCETLILMLRAPERTGNYTVELDMVAEHITWFSDQGSPTARVALEVV